MSRLSFLVILLLLVASCAKEDKLSGALQDSLNPEQAVDQGMITAPKTVLSFSFAVNSASGSVTLETIDAASVHSSEKMIHAGSDGTLELYDDKGQLIQSVPVTLPKNSNCVLPNFASQNNNDAIFDRTVQHFTVGIPDAEGAAFYLLKLTNGTKLTQGKVPKLSPTNDPNGFRLFTDLVPENATNVKQSRTLKNGKNGGTLATPSQRYTIYYIGHGYQNQAEVDAELQRFYGYLPSGSNFATARTSFRGKGCLTLAAAPTVRWPEFTTAIEPLSNNKPPKAGSRTTWPWY
jgi:hypothetical protein